MYATQLHPLKSTNGKFKFAFIGYADILGFGNKVKNKNKREYIVKAYKDIRNKLVDKHNLYFIIQTGRKIAGFGPEVGQPLPYIIHLSNEHIHILSDSIFFILVPENTVDLNLHLYGNISMQIMSRILSIFWKHDLPARGAISAGEVYYDSSEGILIGEPIVKAVSWESNQAFAWFSVEPSSWLAKNIEIAPKGIMGKIAHGIDTTEDLLKQCKVEKYKEDYTIVVKNTYTSWPDYSYNKEKAMKDGIDKSFIFLSPKEVFDYIDKCINQETGKEKRYWVNTKKLFDIIGYAPENIESLNKKLGF